jgi:hypothetical protein
VTRASFRIEESDDKAAPSSRNPDQLALAARDAATAERQRAAFYARVSGDALILCLLERDADESALQPSGYGEGNEMPGEEPAGVAPTPPEERRPNAEAASTRRALARGYTALEIKNARERLKRHALAVAREMKKREP